MKMIEIPQAGAEIFWEWWLCSSIPWVEMLSVHEPL
jgi:hypothetical protein